MTPPGRFFARLVNAWRALRGLGPTTVYRWEDTPIGWFESGAMRYPASGRLVENAWKEPLNG